MAETGEPSPTDAEKAMRVWRHQVMSRQEQMQRTVLQFIQQAIAVAAAAFTSEAVFQILVAILESVAGRVIAGVKVQAIDERDKKYYSIMFRVIHALIASMVTPAICYRLRGDVTKGETVYKDGLLILFKTAPMLEVWAYKDLVVQILSCNTEFWYSLVVSVVATIVQVFLLVLPCVRSAGAAVTAGGAQDTYCRRVLLMPRCLPLAVGYAWNSVADWVVKELQDKVPHVMVKVAVQAIYYLICRLIIIRIYIAWNAIKDKAAKKKEDEQGDGEAGRKDAVAAGQTLGAQFVDVLVASLGFIYAWALSNTWNDWFFWLVENCSSATSCSFRSNMYFALLVSTAIGYAIATDRSHASDNPVVSALNLQTMSLTVGWAWSNAAHVLTWELDDLKFLKAWAAATVLLLTAWPSFIWLHHHFANKVRRATFMDAEDNQAILDCFAPPIPLIKRDEKSSDDYEL